MREMDERRLSIEREAIPIRERIGHADAALAAAQATIDQIDQQLAYQGIDLEPGLCPVAQSHAAVRSAQALDAAVRG